MALVDRSMTCFWSMSRLCYINWMRKNPKIIVNIHFEGTTSFDAQQVLGHCTLPKRDSASSHSIATRIVKNVTSEWTKWFRANKVRSNCIKIRFRRKMRISDRKQPMILPYNRSMHSISCSRSGCGTNLFVVFGSDGKQTWAKIRFFLF